jgi:hypothetical protein
VTARVPEGYLPIAAVDVPRIRAGAVEGCTRFGAGFFAACIRAGLMPLRPVGPVDEVAAELAQREIDRLTKADLYYVSQDMTAWLLMQQPVTTVADATFDRAERRRLARQRLDDRPVRVINLRRRAASTIAGQSDREYHHQWIVRGHWRDQWYASRGVHRPVWIAPHVKGPEGAPMLGGEKVHAWTG